MPSDYAAFDCLFEAPDGTRTALATQTINVRDVTGEADLDDLTTDADGHIPAGSLDIAVDSTVRFSIDLGEGRKGFAEQVTT